MQQVYLINTLIICGIALLIALTAAAIQLIAILIDIRRATKEIKKKIFAVTSAVNMLSMFLGSMEGAGKRIKNKMTPDKSTVIAFAAGVKKGLQVLFGGKED